MQYLKPCRTPVYKTDAFLLLQFGNRRIHISEICRRKIVCNNNIINTFYWWLSLFWLITGKCYFDAFLKFSFNFLNGNLPIELLLVIWLETLTSTLVLHPPCTEGRWPCTFRSLDRTSPSGCRARSRRSWSRPRRPARGTPIQQTTYSSEYSSESVCQNYGSPVLV